MATSGPARPPKLNETSPGTRTSGARRSQQRGREARIGSGVLAAVEAEDVQVGLAVGGTLLEAARRYRQRPALGRTDLGGLALRGLGEGRIGPQLVLEALALLAIALDLGQDLAAAIVERLLHAAGGLRSVSVLLLRLLRRV